MKDLQRGGHLPTRTVRLGAQAEPAERLLPSGRALAAAAACALTPDHRPSTTGSHTADFELLPTLSCNPVTTQEVGK